MESYVTILTWKRKLTFFCSLVESRLLYGLSCVCLTVADRRRLDGFQNRCIRKILRIAPAYYSRVSNKTVLQKAEYVAASQLLLERQLALLGKVIRAPMESPLQAATFIPNTLEPATRRYIRRLGRPRKEWTSTLLEEALRLTGGTQQLYAMTQNRYEWKRVVRVERARH